MWSLQLAGPRMQRIHRRIHRLVLRWTRRTHTRPIRAQVLLILAQVAALSLTVQVLSLIVQVLSLMVQVAGRQAALAAVATGSLMSRSPLRKTTKMT